MLTARLLPNGEFGVDLTGSSPEERNSIRTQLDALDEKAGAKAAGLNPRFQLDGYTLTITIDLPKPTFFSWLYSKIG